VVVEGRVLEVLGGAGSFILSRDRHSRLI
jgi:hypothetical protein